MGDRPGCRVVSGRAPGWRSAYAAGGSLCMAIDVPLALAIVGLGIVIVIAPSSVPGLMPPM
jgi:hypothetical protein